MSCIPNSRNPPLGVGPPGNTGDQGSRGADCLGNWRGSKICAPCANQKLRPVCENGANTAASPDTQSVTTMKKRQPKPMKN